MMNKKKEEQAAQGIAASDADVDLDMDIDSMPDCRLKYQIIVARAKAGRGKFYDA